MPVKKQEALSVITRHKVTAGVIGILALALIVGVVLSFLGNSSRLSSDTLSAPSGGAGMDGTKQYADDFEGEIAEDSASRGESVADVAERRIIQTADLSLIVGSTEEVVDEITGIAEQTDGFVGTVDVFESNNKKHGRITIRVPSDDFSRTIEQIKELAVTVEREQVNAQDVTEEFVDLEARLRNLEATEAQYLRLLDEATDVEDMLAVQRELSSVREDIERLEGRLQYLSRQTNMSTINVSLVSEADVEVFGVTWSPIQEIKEGVRSMLTGVVDFTNAVIAFVFFLPVLLLWLITILVVLSAVWWGGRIVKRRWWSKL